MLFRSAMTIMRVVRRDQVRISVAAINYRFVDGKDVIFPVPQHDSARAVQFLRTKAKEWNLDPQRFACYGGSAGAGTSMWIAFHDDLADPKNADPVLRESTRIVAVGTIGGQGTYDPIEIKRLIGGIQQHELQQVCRFQLPRRNFVPLPVVGIFS